MGLTLNFENDQQVIDNVAAITYTSVANSGNTSVSISDAGMYLGEIREGAPTAGAYQKFPVKWSLRNSLLAPLGGSKPGDLITDSSSLVHTVLTATPPVISGVWQVSTIRLAIAPALAQSGTVTRPTNAKDSTGKLTFATYTTIAAGVVCRLQPIGAEAKDIMQRRTMPQGFTAYLQSQVTPQARDVFTVAGQDYTVLGFHNPLRIDELPTLTCELIDGVAGFPIFSGMPTITGTPVLSTMLTAVPGTVSGSPTFTYQWYSAGVAVPGATGATYTTQSSDLGNLVSVFVVATGSSGITRATSNTVGPIQASGAGSVPNWFGNEMFG